MRQAGTFGRLCRVLKAICLLALAAGAAHAEGAQTEMFDRNTPIQTVIDDPAFGDYGRLLFPVDTGYFSGNTLGNLRLTWYSHIDPDETVEIVNTLRNRVLNGEIVFYDIYTEAEKAADPDKRDTGLFFFKGTPGAKFAVCNAGGGFAYVGAMHDSFPHALELSKKGYNAFALIYRPGAQTACEDLARAIRFIFENAEMLEVDTNALIYQVPGGMLSNLVSQLKQAGKEDKLEEVLQEVPRVREDAGYPPLVTPSSQIVGSQAVFNIIGGERYKMVTKEFKGLVRGEYGATPVPIKPEFVQKIIGDEEPITCRPADLLKPELDKMRDEMKEWYEQEEDVLTYAQFGQVAVKFFEKRRNDRYHIDGDHLHMEEQVHPV